MSMRKTSMCLIFVITLMSHLFTAAQTNVHHIQEEDRPIATGVWVGDTLYLSGQLASPLTPADAAKGTTAVYGHRDSDHEHADQDTGRAQKRRTLHGRRGDDACLPGWRSRERRKTRFSRDDGGLHEILRNQGAAQQTSSQRDAGRGLGRALGARGN